MSFLARVPALAFPLASFIFLGLALHHADVGQARAIFMTGHELSEAQPKEAVGFTGTVTYYQENAGHGRTLCVTTPDGYPVTATITDDVRVIALHPGEHVAVQASTGNQPGSVMVSRVDGLKLVTASSSSESVHAHVLRGTAYVDTTLGSIRANTQLPDGDYDGVFDIADRGNVHTREFRQADSQQASVPTNPNPEED